VSGLQAVVEANGGLDESTGKARAQMETMRQQIIDNAVAHGVDKDAVTAYVDNLLTIPKTVPPTKVDIDKAEAELKLQGFQSAIDRLTGKTVHIYSIEHIQQVRDSGDTPTANAMNTANQYAQGNAYRSEGGPIYRSGGGPANYLAAGGTPFPGVPRGTDTIPAWLTPDEFVMQRASAKSIGPAALNYMNTTGQLPPAGGGQATNVTVYIGNEAIDSHMVRVVQEGMDGVARQIGGMRR
jgi:soluble cytochrome b562